MARAWARGRLSAALLTWLGLLAGGCAALVPQLKPPGVTLAAVELRGGTPQRQQLRLTLHLTNPNDRAIAVRSIDGTLELEGQSFATGTTDAAFTLPAGGAADAVLNVTADMNGALLALAGGLTHSAVGYRLSGQVHLASGLVRTIPFDQRGRVRL
jgi:LEA14-like dessication related protein